MDADKKFEIRLKIIELKLERDKDTFITSMSILVGVITFLYTLGFIPSNLSQWLKDNINTVISPITKLNPFLGLAVVLLIAIALPVLTGIIASRIVTFLVKNKLAIYNDAIKELEKLSGQK